MHLGQPHRHGAHTARGKGQSSGFGHTGQAGRHRILFRGEPAWRHQQRTRCDDEGLVRSGQHFAHGIDGVLVDLPVLGEFREVVDEGEMDCAIRFLGAFAEAVVILERTAMDLGAHFLERLGIGV